MQRGRTCYQRPLCLARQFINAFSITMGLDTSHNCWHGAYGAFMRWRKEVARAAGLPPLELMEGFYQSLKGPRVYSPVPTLYHGVATESEDYFTDLDSFLPIKWECLKPSALHLLLNHSDCDGELRWQDCRAIADELEALIPKMPQADDRGHIGNWKDKTQQFVDGLRSASKAKENVDFH